MGIQMEEVREPLCHPTGPDCVLTPLFSHSLEPFPLDELDQWEEYEEDCVIGARKK